jgi:ATP-dependent Clp protease ATP-binding subunit ClpC
MLRQQQGVAAHVLASLDVTAERVRGQVEHLVLAGEDIPARQIPYTPRVKEVFELALREADSLGQEYVGPEHLLLGIARENIGVAARVLEEFGTDAAQIRSEVLLMLTDAPRARGREQLDGRDGSQSIEVNLAAGARLLLMSAGARALDAGRTEVERDDLLEAVLADPAIEAALLELGVDLPAVRERLQSPEPVEEDVAEGA